MRDNPDRSARAIIPNLEANGWFVARVTNAAGSGKPDTYVAKRFWHALELKSPGGRLRKSQIDFAMSLKARGCYHVAASSWEAELSLQNCEAKLARIATRYDPEAKP